MIIFSVSYLTGNTAFTAKNSAKNLTVCSKNGVSNISKRALGWIHIEIYIIFKPELEFTDQQKIKCIWYLVCKIYS